MKKEFTQQLLTPTSGFTSIRIAAYYTPQGIVSEIQSLSPIDIDDLTKEDAELIYKAAEKIGEIFEEEEEETASAGRDSYRFAITGHYTALFCLLMFAANAGERVKDVQKTNVNASARFRDVVGNDITKINPHVSYTVSGTEVTVL